MVNISDVRRVSMLDRPVLERLQKHASEVDGGIMEIGAYVGGSTIALASGHQGRVRHAVIDCGGSYREHQYLPSDDILRDWRANVSAFGVADHVRLFAGWSTDSRVFRPAIAHSGSIGLFFFDGDGRCAEQFAIFARYMRPGCVVVLDDYVTDEGGKGDLVKPWIDEMTSRDVLVGGELVDDTWFGRIGKLRNVDFGGYRHDAGFAYLMPAPDPALGPVVVLEDGVPLPLGAQRHDDVRFTGHGRYSHWMFSAGPYVLFSTSDNSDPNTNGRRYEVRSLHAKTSLAMPGWFGATGAESP